MACGYVVVDGQCAVFGRRTGGTLEVLHKFSVGVIKHGNESRTQYERRRAEKRSAYLRVVAKVAADIFGAGAGVLSLVFAGTPSFKDDLPSIAPERADVHFVDVSYGGLNGLVQAVAAAEGGEPPFRVIDCSAERY